MLLEPANTIWVPVMPVVPSEFPMLETPPENAPAPAVPPEMLMVPPAASVDCDNVTRPIPASTSRVPVTPVSPRVLPRLDAPNEKLLPPPAIVSITKLLFEENSSGTPWSGRPVPCGWVTSRRFRSLRGYRIATNVLLCLHAEGTDVSPPLHPSRFS